MSTKAGGSDNIFLSTYVKLLLFTCGFPLNIQYLFVYLLKAMSTKAGGSDNIFLSTYVKLLLFTCGFPLNIQYLFVYLLKAMSTKAGGTVHLFLFTYANSFFLHMVLVIIFSVYLFIYLKRCQYKQVETTTCFYLLMQIASSYTWFSF